MFRLVRPVGCVLFCFAVAAPQSGVEAASRPNVIVVMTDDQGYGDFGFTGNPVVWTPHLDAMAARSARLPRFWVSPVCAPTRASLLSGRYNYRTRAIDTFVGRAMMDPAEVTVAEILRDAGYATGIFGKWHLGDCYPMRAIDQGFETALVHRGGGIGQPSDPPGAEGKYTDPVLFRDGVAESQRGYATDVYFDAALAWIERAQHADRPFFVYLPTNAPHGPFDDVPPALLERYSKVDLRGVVDAKDDGQLDDGRLTATTGRVFAMITNIDENVGRLFARLHALDLTRSTLVLFLVDNGPNGPRFAGGLRGQKASVLEGGIRSPFLAHWPGRLPPGDASDRIAAHIDILPTILEAAGVEVPPGLRLDGRSLLPLLERRTVEWPDREIVIQSHRGDVPVRYHNFALIAERWKLVHPSGFGRESFDGEPRFELYDLVDDPFEARDRAAEQAEVVARLRARYDAWFDDVGSTRAENFAPPRIVLGSDHENPVVLTRQDWRHDRGEPWGDGSLGHWLVHVERPGEYAVRVRLRPRDGVGRVTLRVGSAEAAMPIAGGDTIVDFAPLAVTAGDANVECEVTHGDEVRGAWQVEVSRR